MILAIDIGNTNIVLGCVEGKKTFFIERLSTDKAKTELEYAVSLKNVLEIYEIPVDQIEGGIISSVVPQVTELCRVCIITNKYLISGDLLTNDSIGRTDFIGGNVNDMFFSLEKVLKLSDSLIVLPGHGAVTTMEKIKNCNPYVKRILQKI